MLVKNLSAIILDTPPSMRCPTEAISPPTCTSAVYATFVPLPLSVSVMSVSLRMNPGPPEPSAASL